MQLEDSIHYELRLLLLVAGLSAVALWLRGTSRRTFVSGPWPLAQFGLRNARYRPSRSVLSVALIAAATFLIVSIGAFRRGADDSLDPKSATGGYSLIAETVAPLMHDPSTPAGREALNLNAVITPFSVARFRLRPGDDASCLNLYRPQSPRLLGATDAEELAAWFVRVYVAPATIAVLVRDQPAKSQTDQCSLIARAGALGQHERDCRGRCRSRAERHVSALSVPGRMESRKPARWLSGRRNARSDATRTRRRTRGRVVHDRGDEHGCR